jgi:hypothetical protein
LSRRLAAIADQALRILAHDTPLKMRPDAHCLIVPARGRGVFTARSRGMEGGRYWDRTSDFLGVNEALSR